MDKTSLLRHLNLNVLLVFKAVYETRSMTRASELLGMTQPGVTQHIRNLESTLEVAFFERSGKRIVPSKAAERLYETVVESIMGLENVLSSITNKDQKMCGTVRIGVPIEFGNAKVLPRLAPLRRAHPLVQFHITYGLPHELNALILEGNLDFAFIDQYQVHPSVRTEDVYREDLILCCSKEYRQGVGPIKKEREFFEALTYVDYRPKEEILRNWFERAFGFKKMSLSMAAYSFDVQGIAALVKSGMGVGVLPEHVFKKLKSEGALLYQFRPRTKAVQNIISLVYLEQRSSEPLNQLVIDTLKKSMS